MAYLRDLFDLDRTTWQVDRVREWKRKWGTVTGGRVGFYADEDGFHDESGAVEVKEVGTVKKGLKNPLRRRNILEEILSTERTYVHGLEELVDIYIQPSRGHLSDEDRKVVFSNVQNILTFHREHFLPMLEVEAGKSDEGDNLACVGKVFANHVAYMKMYSFYVNNFDHAMDTVQHWFDGGRKNKKAKVFLQQCRLNPNHSQLNIQGYLLLPVQRIPRYKMLLEDLLKHTDETHGDYADLVKATEEMGLRADEMNERKRNHERHEKVIEIQNQIKWNDMVPLVQPHRHLVREGTLHLNYMVRATPCFELHGSEIIARERETIDKDFKLFLFNDIMLQCKPNSSGAQLDLVRILYLETRLEPASLRAFKPQTDENATTSVALLRLVDAETVYYFSGERDNLSQWKRDINSRW